MKNLEKMGGIGSLIGAATNLFALVVFAIYLVPNGEGSGYQDIGKYIAFLVDNQVFMRLFDIIIYLIFGISLILLSLGIYERLKTNTNTMAQAVTVMGLVYAVLVIVVGTLSISSVGTVANLYTENPIQAASAWITLQAVSNGLGAGGGETMVNGLWILLLSFVALKSMEFPRILNYFGLTVGIAGVLSVFIPSLLVISVIYGLGLIIWLAWLGIVLLRPTRISVV
jgi:hypothetical protein